MKTILTTALMLAGMVCLAQNEMLLKSRYEVSNGDTTRRYDYDYDENWEYPLKCVSLKSYSEKFLTFLYKGQKNF
jgi:hypothetical protein